MEVKFEAINSSRRRRARSSERRSLPPAALVLFAFLPCFFRSNFFKSFNYTKRELKGLVRCIKRDQITIPNSIFNWTKQQIQSSTKKPDPQLNYEEHRQVIEASGILSLILPGAYKKKVSGF